MGLKVLLLPVEIRIFGPKKAKFYPNMLSWAHIGLAVSFGALLVCSCGARAVSRKTPIYFIMIIIIRQEMILILGL